MFDRLMFKELLFFMMESLNEKLIIKQDGDSKYVITDNGINTDEENFTQINFRFENNTLIIPWFYLCKQNKGIGSNIMKWFIEFCIENGINAIEVRSVRQDKQGMKKLLKKFGFEMIQSDDEYMSFRKVL
jgi:GNAT superfamily N-acetyltransferase